MLTPTTRLLYQAQATMAAAGSLTCVTRGPTMMFSIKLKPYPVDGSEIR